MKFKKFIYATVLAGTLSSSVQAQETGWFGWANKEYLTELSADYSQKSLMIALGLTVSMLAWQGWQSHCQYTAQQQDDYVKGLECLLTTAQYAKDSTSINFNNKDIKIKTDASLFGGSLFFYPWLGWKTSLESLVDTYVDQLKAKKIEPAKSILKDIRTCVFAGGYGKYYVPQYQ